MFVASMTDGGDKYYSNKYFRAWMWNGSANQVISSPEWITMTGANYGGVAYCILKNYLSRCYCSWRGNIGQCIWYRWLSMVLQG